MKRMLSAILAAILLITMFSACGEDVIKNYDELETDLPSKVDLRNFNGKNYVTPVKSQRFGDCWSFSLAGSAEISYLYANDLGVPAGEVNNNVDFSEKYIAWYVFHGITEDDVITGKVRESQIGEGFDPSKAEKADENAAYNFGGECVHYSNLFGSGFGPVEESVSVNEDYPYKYSGSSDGDWSLPLNNDYRNAKTDAFLRSSRVLQSPASLDKNGKYKFNEEGLKAIKSELYKGHGVSLAFSSSGPFNVDTLAAYYSGDEPADHAVTVVGYDDNFPKENFATKNDKDNIPPGNGALIIKNSWGTTGDEDEGIDDGYFYLSYYDHSIVSPLSYEFDKTDSLKHTEINYDQYDLLMTKWYGSTDYETETKMANVFDAEEDESLFQISYTTASPDIEVTYEIYKNVESGNPSSGMLLEKGTSRHIFGGSHKIDLKGEYSLKKGDKYSVVLTMKHVGDDEQDTVYTEVFPYSTIFGSGLSVRGIINEGESYLYSDGEWHDMTEQKDSLIKRAYQQCDEEIGSKETFSKIQHDSEKTFTVDNYPIKAILGVASRQ